MYVCRFLGPYQRMNIPDMLSISVGLLYVIPFTLYFFTGNAIHLTAFLGVIGTTLISETLKYFFVRDVSVRPKGAKNCNFLCNDGGQSGKPGMPSSHSASVAFFSGFYYYQTNNKFIRIALLIYPGFVMLSRYWKRCHTISQIIGGALLGLSLSFVVVRHL
jgi:membrane-associated phospholipid phosphatase